MSKSSLLACVIEVMGIYALLYKYASAKPQSFAKSFH